MLQGGLSGERDLGSSLEVLPAGRQVMTGAAPAAVTGAGIDRLPPGGGDASYSQCEFIDFEISIEHTLAVGVTVDMTLDPEHADPDLNTDPTGATVNAATWANVGTSHQPTSASATQRITGTGAGVTQVVRRYGLRVKELKKFVRLNMPAPTFGGGAGAGDIVRIQIVAVIGGRKVITRSQTWVPNYTTA